LNPSKPRYLTDNSCRPQKIEKFFYNPFIPGHGAPMSNGKLLLEFENLKTFFCTYDRAVRVLNGYSSEVSPGEVLERVSGSCWTGNVVPFSIMVLISKPRRADPGQFLLDGEIIGESLLIHNITNEKETN
jgi:ABC-type microcin C transport system duplicated ATPase subunit YejF